MKTPDLAVPNAGVRQVGKCLACRSELVGGITEQRLPPAFSVEAGLQKSLLKALGTGAAFGQPCLELDEGIPEVVTLPRTSVALGILREAIFFDLVEPNVFGARVLAGKTLLFLATRLFAKNQNGGLDAGVGLKHAARQ